MRFHDRDVLKRAGEIISNAEDAYYDYAFGDEDETEVKELLDELIDILEKLEEILK